MLGDLQSLFMLMNHLFRRIILGKTNINDFFEEEVLYWAEDHDIVKGMVEKTVKSFNPESDKKIQLHVLSLNWDDDRDFIERLFREGAMLNATYKDLIANNTGTLAASLVHMSMAVELPEPRKADGTLDSAAAYYQFRTLLRLQGYTVVQGDDLDRVLPEADAKLQSSVV